MATINQPAKSSVVPQSRNRGILSRLFNPDLPTKTGVSIWRGEINTSRGLCHDIYIRVGSRAISFSIAFQINRWQCLPNGDYQGIKKHE